MLFVGYQRDFDKPHLPSDDVVPAVQPPGIALTLKRYQLKTIAWMRQVEEHVDAVWLVSRLIKWEGVSHYFSKLFTT